MPGALVRYDLSLPCYFSYPPSPDVVTRPMIPRLDTGLYIRGEVGARADGAPRPISPHATTHLDTPYHFLPAGTDLAGVLNAPAFPADRPCLARLVHLAGPGPGAFTREGVTYREAVTAGALPPVAELRRYEALVVLTGFGRVMAAEREGQFPPAADGANHVPHLAADAVERILAAGLRLVALDSTTVEPQTGTDPLRYGSEVHQRLLGHAPPVLIVECIGGGRLAEQVGFAPGEALLHVVPRRVNARGADAAQSRVFLYFYRDDPDGAALRELHRTMTPEELYG